HDPRLPHLPLIPYTTLFRSPMPAERLQKIIAAAGIASRRKAEQLIVGGLVSVNGQVVTELGTKADAEGDHIRVNGKLLRGAQKRSEEHTSELQSREKLVCRL